VPDVLILGDTVRSPELRHEIPLAVPDAFLYVEHDGERHAIVTAFELPRIDELGLELAVHPPERFGRDELLAAGKEPHEADVEVWVRACRELGVERAVTPWTFPLDLADRLRAAGVDVSADPERFVERRRVKTAAELDGIRRAQRAAEAAMRAASELLAAAEPADGVLRVDGSPLTSERIRAAIDRVFMDCDVTADQTIVAHGAQGAVGHDEGSGEIAPREAVVIDLFPRDRASGCYADMTRTFVVGEPSEELLTYHRLCRDALERALDAITPGVAGSELHRLVCELFEEHGFATQLSKEPGSVLTDGFFHSLGHGVGLEVHEAPSLGRGGGRLVAGDVVSVEPGLYRQGYGGVRLEDLVLVTDDGAENLTRFPYDLAPKGA
jgi:Xaa-Pro aminopeptidase